MKKLLHFSLSLLAIIFLTYCGVWYYMGAQIKTALTQLYEVDGPALGYQFHGDKPTLSGFPFKPVVTYHKGFSKNGLNITFDTLKVSGIPLASYPIDIDVKEFGIEHSLKGDRYNIDSIESRFILPEYLPQKLTQSELRQWHEDVKQLEIESLAAKINGTLIKARGFIGMDDDLQPVLNMKTLIADYENITPFIETESNKLSPLKSKMILTMLNSLAEIDEASGKKLVRLTLQIRQRRLIIGIVKTIVIPEITWPKEE